MMGKSPYSRAVTALALAVLATGAVLFALVRQTSPEAEAHYPHAGLDFSIGVQGAACDSTSGPFSCSATTPFTVTVRLSSIPAGFSYGGYDSEIQFSGGTLVPGSLVQQGAGTWPACYFAASYPSAGQLNASCAINVQSPHSSYTGILWRVGLQCTTVPSTVSVTLINGSGHTQIVDNALTPHGEGTGSEALTVQCTAPPPTPTATPTRTPTPTATPTATPTPFIDDDGDGCSNGAEQQTKAGSETTGGRRDFLNQFDYFNPSHDRLNRVDDILLAVNAYFQDDNDATPGQPPYNPGYGPDTDRTLVGPLAWHLGAPDGLQRVDDILHIVKQYFHDCVP